MIGNIIMSDNKIMAGEDYINRIEKAFTRWNVNELNKDYYKERRDKFENEKQLLLSGLDLNSFDLRFDDEERITTKYRNGEMSKYEKSIYELFYNKILNKVNIWMIDPPYAGDVNYGELSEGFLACDKILINRAFPEWKITRENFRGTGEDFNTMMSQVWDTMKLRLHYDGYLVLMFASSKESVWRDLFEGLNHKFTLTSFYPITVEPASSIKAKKYTITMTMTFKHVETRAKLNTKPSDFNCLNLGLTDTDKKNIDWVFKYAKVW